MGRKLAVFALFYFVLEGKFQVQASQGAYIRRGDLTEDFLRYDFMGLINGMAYFRNFTLFGLSITRQTSDANDLVYAKNHAREKPLLTGNIYRNYFEDASRLSSTLGTRGFFSRVRRGTSFCRPQADTCSAKGRTDTSGNRATWHPGYLSSHH